VGSGVSGVSCGLLRFILQFWATVKQWQTCMVLLFKVLSSNARAKVERMGGPPDVATAPHQQTLPNSV
jgi:hypothetical protein